MEAVGQLTGGIAHDFNNLLTVVLGNLDLMERHAVGNERMQRQFAAMRHAAERGADADRAVARFLAPPAPQPGDARRQRAGARLRAADPPRARREHRVEDHARATRCRLAKSTHRNWKPSLLNLAVNARDAMPDGGEIMLTVRRRRARRGTGCAIFRGRGRSMDRHFGIRQRRRHAAHVVSAGIRAVLHHQGSRQGQRARPVAGLWLRAAVGRLRHADERGRRGNADLDLPAGLGQAAHAARSAAKTPVPSQRARKPCCWSRTTRRCSP